MRILLTQLYSSQPTPDYDKIAAEMRARGHDVWVGTPNAAGAVEWLDGDRVVATQPAVGRSRLPRPIAGRLAKIALLKRVRRFVRQVQPDIVQLNAFDLFRLMPLGMPRRIHFILDMRQINELYGSGLFGRAKAAVLNRSRALYSRALFERTTFLHEAGAEQVLGRPWPRWATVVPMGVDPQFLTATHREPGSDGDAPVNFIYIGRLARRRQLERVLEAAARVRQRTDRFRVVFIGYDASDGYYAETIRRLELDDLVCIRPPVPYEQVPEVVPESDVALAYVPELPADWQYHPTLKILEYRALGMPVIASDFLPNRSFVENEVNGLLTSNTPDDIAAAMLRFINDPEFLTNCRANAQAMREGLTWDKVAEDYLDLYGRLAAGRTMNTPAAERPERAV
jgi:glycosyltransferase involved in cell wall biosynthesis